MSIKNQALIVSLFISQWTARKHDKKATEEVNTNHNASQDAGRYNKQLISKEHLQKINTIASQARDFHYQNTLPWSDNNERLLPTKNYFAYVEKMAVLKDQFDEAVTGFFTIYDDAIIEAKSNLGSLFNESDYPKRTEIESKFGLKPTFTPVPDTDFRVQLSDEEVERLRKSVGAEITNRLDVAVKDIWNRVADQLQKMKERLSQKDAIFKNSLFDNLKELIELLPKLNVTNDINIAKVCNDLSGLLVDPDSVRKNESLRSEKAEQVEQVLSKFKGFFA